MEIGVALVEALSYCAPPFRRERQLPLDGAVAKSGGDGLDNGTTKAHACFRRVGTSARQASRAQPGTHTHTQESHHEHHSHR